MSWKIHSFSEDQQLVETLATDISRKLQAAIVSRQKASLAVSGGSTPLGLFTRLSNTDIEWDKVSITLVDERWVGEESPDSNAALVQDRLLKGKASCASFIGLKNEQPDPFVAADQVHERLKQLPMPLDVAVLGMGEDGHTASFFVGSRGIEQAMDLSATRLCAAVEPANAPHSRMTLTLPTILAAENLYLHIVGDKKRQVLEQALTDGPAGSLPIGQLLHHSNSSMQIYFAENP